MSLNSSGFTVFCTMQVLLWHTIGFVLGFLPSEVRGSDCGMVLTLEFVDVDYHLSASSYRHAS